MPQAPRLRPSQRRGEDARGLAATGWPHRGDGAGPVGVVAGLAACILVVVLPADSPAWVVTTRGTSIVATDDLPGRRRAHAARHSGGLVGTVALPVPHHRRRRHLRRPAVPLPGDAVPRPGRRPLRARLRCRAARPGDARPQRPQGQGPRGMDRRHDHDDRCGIGGRDIHHHPLAIGRRNRRSGQPPGLGLPPAGPARDLRIHPADGRRRPGESLHRPADGIVRPLPHGRPRLQLPGEQRGRRFGARLAGVALPRRHRAAHRGGHRTRGGIDHDAVRHGAAAHDPLAAAGTVRRRPRPRPSCWRTSPGAPTGWRSGSSR